MAADNTTRHLLRDAPAIAQHLVINPYLSLPFAITEQADYCSSIGSPHRWGLNRTTASLLTFLYDPQYENQFKLYTKKH